MCKFLFHLSMLSYAMYRENVWWWDVRKERISKRFTVHIHGSWRAAVLALKIQMCMMCSRKTETASALPLFLFMYQLAFSRMWRSHRSAYMIHDQQLFLHSRHRCVSYVEGKRRLLQCYVFLSIYQLAFSQMWRPHRSEYMRSPTNETVSAFGVAHCRFMTIVLHR